MADEIIEIGEDVEVEVVFDEDGMPVGAIVDDLVVATSESGSVIDETIDVLDADGNLVLEDEIVSVFDADGNLVAVEETVTTID